MSNGNGVEAADLADVDAENGGGFLSWVGETASGIAGGIAAVPGAISDTASGLWDWGVEQAEGAIQTAAEAAGTTFGAVAGSGAAAGEVIRGTLAGAGEAVGESVEGTLRGIGGAVREGVGGTLATATQPLVIGAVIVGIVAVLYLFRD